MKNAYLAFMAFFIPFSAAVMLLALGGHIFQNWKINNQSPVERTFQQIKQKVKIEYIDNRVKKEELVFGLGIGTPRTLEVQDLYEFLILSLFILSFVSPIFVISRNKPIKRNELKLFN